MENFIFLYKRNKKEIKRFLVQNYICHCLTYVKITFKILFGIPYKHFKQEKSQKNPKVIKKNDKGENQYNLIKQRMFSLKK